MLTDKPWKLEPVLWLGLGLMGCLIGVGLAGSSLPEPVPEQASSSGSYLRFLFGTLGFHGVSLVLVAVFLRWHQMSWVEFLGLRQLNLKRCLLLSLATLAVVLPSVLGLNALSAWLLSLAGFEPAQQEAVQVLLATKHLDQMILFGFTAIVLAPLVEEILFRGILYTFLKHRVQPAFGLWISSLIFATVHANAMTFVPLTVFAMVLVWLYERTDTLLTPIATHAIFNAANFALLVTHWDPFASSLDAVPKS